MFSKPYQKLKEYWLKHGDFPKIFNFKVSDIGTLSSSNPPDSENIDKIILLSRERLLSEQHSLVSVVIDKADFLPISLLQTGAKQSIAVCRIARYFSLKELKKIITEVQEEVIKSGNISNFNSPAKVKEIFSIPDHVANEINKSFENSSQPLELLENISEAVLAKINPIPIGTGFLVGGTHLLTNNHVIPDQKTAEQCVAQFNYIRDDQGRIQSSIDYSLKPKILFVTDPSLDYTLVQLQSGMFTRQAGFSFNWIQVIEDDENIAPGGVPYLKINGDMNKLVQDRITELELAGYTIKIDKIADYSTLVIWRSQENSENIKATKEELDKLKNSLEKLDLKNCELNYTRGDSVIIVQHPKGKPKQMASNNVIYNGLYKNFLRYETDSDYGSSGSPVFNARWELVGLHHAAIPAEPQNNYNQENLRFTSQQGIRICRIIEDLKKKSFSNSKLASFIEDFVVTSEQLNYPPLPSALEFDGESSDVDLGDLNLSIAEGITFEAWINRNSMSGDGTIFSQGSDFSVSWRVGKIWVNVPESQVYTIKAVLIDNCWHHVALILEQEKVKDNQQSPVRFTLKIYLDGEEEPLSSTSIHLSTMNDNLHLGSGKADYFTGFMAEFRIWGVVRNQKQIQDNMYRRLSKYDQTELRGYWRFEEDKSYKVYNLLKATKNEEDNSNDFKKDRLGYGLQLNGKSDFIDCGKDEKFKIEDAITIEAWVKKSDLNNGIIVNQGGSWDKHGYCLWINDKKIRVELQNKNHILVDTQKVFVQPEENTKTSNLKLDNWYHIACTWSRNSTENIEIYVDGIKQDTTLISGDLAKKLSDEPIEEFQVNLNIGRAEGYGFHFNGAIAEVRVWKIARTKNDIENFMYKKLQEDEQGLVGYWRLDENEEYTAKNLARNDSYSDGVVRGGKWLKPYYDLATNQGKYGVVYRTNRLRASQYPGLPLPFGLKFNESSAHVDCGSGDELNTPKAITVEAWVKHKFGNCLILSRGGNVNEDSGNVEKGYSLSWHNGKIRVALHDVSEKTIVYSKENAPVDRVWHHIAFTWDNISQEIAIYVDGIRQDSIVEGKSNAIVFEGQNKIIGLFAGSIDNSLANLFIGKKQDEETEYYDVAIADVRLWKVTRTQDEIKANMSRRLEGDEEGLVGYWRLDDGGKNNQEVCNLVPNSKPGKIHGATWFPEPPKLTEDTNTNTNQENTSEEEVAGSSPSITQ
ncbi:MAG: LamG-like jellyroll fold domain-containing protein [Nostoc sp.]|uniref:LamG-like jellyroll fold domain-containing protein n=1 Tax=Nostoc sp. TaxID=1180 RepID=UPI002FFB7737